MKKKLKVVPYLLTILLITLACEIGSVGGPVFIFGGDETPNPMAEYFSGTDAMIPKNESETTLQEPEDKPLETQDSVNVNAETDNASSNEYSVTATNFDCVCQVDGNVTQEFSVKGDQLFIGVGEGEQVYEKISENTYKRSWMGYYILRVDGKDTEVDEEQSVVIILTDNGYIMEHYQGSNSSPCCFHTFIKTK